MIRPRSRFVCFTAGCEYWRTAALMVVGASILVVGASCQQARSHPEIRAVLDAQAGAWNAGDLEGFMRGYWKSDDLVFTTPEGEVRGWQATLDRYRRKYDTPDAMGQLTFEGLTVARTGDETADISGAYRLDTAQGRRSGRFYLKMRRIDGDWVIVRDHTVPN